MKKLSIIIVSYNHYDILKECIESIVEYNDIGDELEIIVSDNSPNNNIINNLKRDYQFIKTIHNDNIGFGPGNNKGYYVSEGKYLLFLNPDTIIIEPIFKFVVNKFENDDKLGLFGLKLIDKKYKRNHSFFLMDEYRILPTILFKLFDATDCYIDNRMYISGANIFVRRSTFEEAGKFDNNIFMYFEEPDLIKRIKKNAKSKKTSFYKAKHIIHLEGGTEEQNNEGVKRQITRSLETYKYYCKKWSIPFQKNVIRMMKYQKIKKRIYKILGQKRGMQTADELSQLYEIYLGMKAGDTQ